MSRPGFRIASYNFFASHHGHSACDAAASHGKKRINVKARDDGAVLDSAQNLCNAINTLHNTTAQPVNIYDTEKREYKTMEGITKGHMFLINSPGHICSFATSSVHGPAPFFSEYLVEGEVMLKGGEHVIVKDV